MTSTQAAYGASATGMCRPASGATSVGMPSAYSDAIASPFQCPASASSDGRRVAAGGGRLLPATGAALEPLDDGAAGAALFGALLEEATGDRVAYPAAFARASPPSHELKVVEPSCSFNFPGSAGRVIALHESPTGRSKAGRRIVNGVGRPPLGGSAPASCECPEDGRAVTSVSLSVGVGLICALLSALGTNLAFLFKYKGAVAAPDVDMRHPLRSASTSFARSGGASAGALRRRRSRCTWPR